MDKLTPQEAPLRQKVEKILADIVERQKMLHKNIEEYKEAGEYESAMKCDIKTRTLILVEVRLIEALTN